jgi:hypothetical protein
MNKELIIEIKGIPARGGSFPTRYIESLKKSLTQLEKIELCDDLDISIIKISSRDVKGMIIFDSFGSKYALGKQILSVKAVQEIFMENLSWFSKNPELFKFFNNRLC